MMYTGINLMLPTYRRVVNGMLPRMLSSIVKTATNLKGIFLTLLVNSDDQESLSFLREYDYSMFGGRQVLVNNDTAEPHLARFYNVMYAKSKFSHPANLVSMIGDDMYFVTSGWDVGIITAMNEHKGVALVYLNDGGRHGHRLCVNLFTSRLVVDATEAPFMLPNIRMNVIDSAWMALALTGKFAVYLKKFILYHDHSSLRPSALRDVTYRRLRKHLTYAPHHRDQIRQYVASSISHMKAKGLLCK